MKPKTHPREFVFGSFGSVLPTKKALTEKLFVSINAKKSQKEIFPPFTDHEPCERSRQTDTPPARASKHHDRAPIAIR
jgi:hypothetical protein